MEASSFKVQDIDVCGGCGGGFQRVAALGQGWGGVVRDGCSTFPLGVNLSCTFCGSLFPSLLQPLSNAHSWISVIAPSLGHPLRLQGYFPCGEGGIYSENSH